VASLARFFRIFLNILVFSLLLGAGCRAQSSSADGALSAETSHRIRTEIRARYNVPAQIEIALGAPQPSTVNGYDKIVVTFTGGSHSSTHDFLISKDRKTLAHLETFDITQDLMSRIDVKGRPVRGNTGSKVTIVNFDDFQCPFCSRMHATLFPNLLKTYGDRIKIVYKDYPLVEIHPWAMHAAIDGNCLADQNNEAYWNYADYVHANQKQIAGSNRGEALLNLDKVAREEGAKQNVDPQKLDACMKKQDESGVRASMAEGDKLGVDSTPTLFINGERLAGAVPEEEMRKILDRALAEAGAPPVPAPAAKQSAPTPNAKN
jgi:protein-disulfide isomerase